MPSLKRQFYHGKITIKVIGYELTDFQICRKTVCIIFYFFFCSKIYPEHINTLLFKSCYKIKVNNYYGEGRIYRVGKGQVEGGGISGFCYWLG